MGLRIARIRESNEKMSVDEIAGRLQTCAFDETSVPKLGTEGAGGISVMRAGRVTVMDTGTRCGWMNVRGREVMGTQMSRSSRAHRRVSLNKIGPHQRKGHYGLGPNNLGSKRGPKYYHGVVAIRLLRLALVISFRSAGPSSGLSSSNAQSKSSDTLMQAP